MQSTFKSPVKSTWGILSLTLLALLLIFLICEALGLAALTDPARWMQTQSAGAAAIGVGLLTLDALLPVPASLVMLTNGALFGMWLGAALSLVGSVGAAIMAFAIGRRGTVLLDRHLAGEERWRAEQRITRWGWLAIVVTRPVPLLSETTLLAAGASRMGWGTMLAATLLGALPTAFAFAYAGATVGSFDSNPWLWPAALLLYGVLVLFGLLRIRMRVAVAGS